MAFRLKQSLKFQPFGKIYLHELRHLENGEVELFQKDQSESDLPSSETTDLKNVLDAGIDLKQVDSRILGLRRVTIHTESEKDSQTVQLSNDDKEKGAN